MQENEECFSFLLFFIFWVNITQCSAVIYQSARNIGRVPETSGCCLYASTQNKIFESEKQKQLIVYFHQLSCESAVFHLVSTNRKNHFWWLNVRSISMVSFHPYTNSTIESTSYSPVSPLLTSRNSQKIDTPVTLRKHLSLVNCRGITNDKPIPWQVNFSACEIWASCYGRSSPWLLIAGVSRAKCLIRHFACSPCCAWSWTAHETWPWGELSFNSPTNDKW